MKKFSFFILIYFNTLLSCNPVKSIDKEYMGEMLRIASSCQTMKNNQLFKKTGLDSIESIYIDIIDDVIDGLCDTLAKNPENYTRPNFILNLFSETSTLQNKSYNTFLIRFNEIIEHNGLIDSTSLYIDNQKDFFFFYLNRTPIHLILYLTFWEIELINQYSSDNQIK